MVYTVNEINTNSNITLTGSGDVYYVIVGGGGSGGQGGANVVTDFLGAGGGAGGSINSGKIEQFNATTYIITIGDGGAAAGSNANGNEGEPSSIQYKNNTKSETITAKGGGGGNTDLHYGKKKPDILNLGNYIEKGFTEEGGSTNGAWSKALSIENTTGYTIKIDNVAPPSNTFNGTYGGGAGGADMGSVGNYKSKFGGGYGGTNNKSIAQNGWSNTGGGGGGERVGSTNNAAKGGSGIVLLFYDEKIQQVSISDIVKEATNTVMNEAVANCLTANKVTIQAKLKFVTDEKLMYYIADYKYFGTDYKFVLQIPPNIVKSLTSGYNWTIDTVTEESKLADGNILGIKNKTETDFNDAITKFKADLSKQIVKYLINNATFCGKTINFDQNLYKIGDDYYFVGGYEGDTLGYSLQIPNETALKIQSYASYKTGYTLELLTKDYNDNGIQKILLRSSDNDWATCNTPTVAPTTFATTPFATTSFATTPFATTTFAPTPFATTSFATTPFATTSFATTPFATTSFAPTPFATTSFATTPFATTTFAPTTPASTTPATPIKCVTDDCAIKNEYTTQTTSPSYNTTTPTTITNTQPIGQVTGQGQEDKNQAEPNLIPSLKVSIDPNTYTGDNGDYKFTSSAGDAYLAFVTVHDRTWTSTQVPITSIESKHLQTYKKATITGHWVQAQLPFQAYISNYKIQLTTQNTYNIVLAGSDDGNSWFYIDEQVSKSTTTELSFDAFPLYKYSYIRLIINTSDLPITIKKVELYGTIEKMYKPSYKLPNPVPTFKQIATSTPFPSLNIKSFDHHTRINIDTYNPIQPSIPTTSKPTRTTEKFTTISDTPNYKIDLGNKNTGSFYQYNVNRMFEQSYSTYDNDNNQLINNSVTKDEYKQENTPVNHHVDVFVDDVCKDLINDYDKANKCITSLRAGDKTRERELIQIMSKINDKEGFLVSRIEGFREGMTEEEYTDNINQINDVRNSMTNKGSPNLYQNYDYDGNLVMGNEYDGNQQLVKSKNPEIIDAVIEDSSQMIYYENTWYILGTITISVLLISILSVSRS